MQCSSYSLEHGIASFRFCGTISYVEGKWSAFSHPENGFMGSICPLLGRKPWNINYLCLIWMDRQGYGSTSCRSTSITHTEHWTRWRERRNPPGALCLCGSTTAARKKTSWVVSEKWRLLHQLKPFRARSDKTEAPAKIRQHCLA